MANLTAPRVGPASVLYGDPTQADGAGMVNLGDIETVTFDPGIASTGVTTAQTGDAYDAAGIYALPPNPTVQAELYEHSLAVLEALVLGGEKVTTGTAPDEVHAIGFGGPIELVTVGTLVLVPTFEKSLGVAAPNAIWIPAAAIENLSGFTYNRMQSGGNSGNAFTVNFKGARRAKDQADTAIPEKAQFAFIGDPAAMDLTWYLPAL